MTRTVLTLFAALLSQTALAAPADDQADIRCLILSGQMADSEVPEQKTAGSIMLFYYLGRIDGRNPSADLVKLIKEETEQMTEERQQQLLQSCSARLDQRGKLLSSIASQLDPAQ